MTTNKKSFAKLPVTKKPAEKVNNKVTKTKKEKRIVNSKICDLPSSQDSHKSSQSSQGSCNSEYDTASERYKKQVP